METREVRKLAQYLNRLNAEQLNFVRKATTIAVRKHVKPSEAAVYAKFSAGEHVTFTDRKQKTHVGMIAKVNRKFIRIIDDKSNDAYNVLPSYVDPVMMNQQPKRGRGRPRKVNTIQ